MLEVELRPEQASLFKKVLEALSSDDDLFSKAHLDFSRTGLELQALDRSHIALVVLVLRADAFRRYRCDDRDLSVGLNLADMAKALRCANHDDIVTITAVYFSYTVSFTFESPEDGEISYFDLDFVGVNSVPFKIPESEYQAIVRMPSAKFMHICNKLSSFVDKDNTVLIWVTKERVDFCAQAIIVCKQTQDKPKEATLIIEMKEEVSLTFDLRCMNSFSKASTLSDQVTIRLSSKLPAVFEYKIAGMGYIRYMLRAKGSGDETQRIAKEDEMQNEGDEMHN